MKNIIKKWLGLEQLESLVLSQQRVLEILMKESNESLVRDLAKHKKISKQGAVKKVVKKKRK